MCSRKKAPTKPVKISSCTDYLFSTKSALPFSLHICRCFLRSNPRVTAYSVFFDQKRRKKKDPKILPKNCQVETWKVPHTNKSTETVSFIALVKKPDGSKLGRRGFRTTFPHLWGPTGAVQETVISLFIFRFSAKKKIFGRTALRVPKSSLTSVLTKPVAA